MTKMRIRWNESQRVPDLWTAQTDHYIASVSIDGDDFIWVVNDHTNGEDIASGRSVERDHALATATTALASAEQSYWDDYDPTDAELARSIGGTESAADRDAWRRLH